MMTENEVLKACSGLCNITEDHRKRVAYEFDNHGLVAFASAIELHIAARASAEPTQIRNVVLEEAAALLEMTRQDIRLLAGEISGTEMRCVLAILEQRARAIRALKAPSTAG